jgi:hypothetical protein
MGLKRRGDTALKGLGIGLLAGVGAGFLLAYQVDEVVATDPAASGT